MKQYIDKSAVVAEIKRRINEINLDTIEDWRYRLQREHDIEVMKNILSLIDTLEIKEVEESKLPSPRFPHLNNIVDKVFGTGNLESLEYEEAEQLVLLAKEELLKDLEVREVDLEKELDSMITPELKFHKALPSLFDVAKHFFELGLKAQKGDKE